ncbi:DAK2 domain-containing protein, partial [Promicromonospora kroppenstedtii]
MTLDADWAERWVRRTAVAVADAKDELTELDRQIGDGDHGENMDRGFRAVVARLDDAAAQPAGADERTVGDVLKLVATTLMSTVGGASGPLYGTAYLRAAKVSGRPQIDPPAVVAVLEAALEGVSSRGKATVG